MIDNHSKVMALLAAASLLVITAIFILAFQLGFFGGNAKVIPVVRQNHSEVVVLNSKK